MYRCFVWIELKLLALHLLEGHEEIRGFAYVNDQSYEVQETLINSFPRSYALELVASINEPDLAMSQSY